MGGLTTKALHATFDSEEVGAILRLLEAGDKVSEVPSVGWVHPEALTSLEASVERWFDEHDILRPADFKEMTGLTRKAAIPLLEWLDQRRVTQRQGDARVAGPALRGR